MSSYQEFLKTKHIAVKPSGFDPKQVNDKLFPFQKEIVKWAIRKGRCGLFKDTGLGKTAAQLSWADEIIDKTGGKILVLCPLAVAKQTLRESAKFDIRSPVKIVDSQDQCGDGISLTNYEKLHRFDAERFSGVVLDESSILKSLDGSTKKHLIEAFALTPFKLCCTATPAPNDHMELGNHAEFLGIMTRAEMLSMFFVHDGGDTSKWRLRGHAEKEFWKWMASWCVMIRKPSDIGFSDDGYDLPPLTINEHVIETTVPDHLLFNDIAGTLGERREARRDTIEERTVKMCELIPKGEPCIVWCNLNEESKLATKMLKDRGAVEITGSDKTEVKEQRMIGFTDGSIPIIVTKSKIAGFGMNWQHCNNEQFLGLSDSYEQFYQAIRRCYRFGQQRPVTVNVIVSDREASVLDNIKRKQADADRMAAGMISAMAEWTKIELGVKSSLTKMYNPKKRMQIPSWLA